VLVDRRPDRATTADQAVALEALNGRAHGGAADVEHRRELVLGRQPAAEAILEDRVEDRSACARDQRNVVELFEA